MVGTTEGTKQMKAPTMFKIKPKFEVNIYPYIEDNTFNMDVVLNGQEDKTVSVELTKLFKEYLEFRTVVGQKRVSPNHRQEVIEMVATLRYVAKEMENEVDDLIN
jgi:hypothetical protein